MSNAELDDENILPVDQLLSAFAIVVCNSYQQPGLVGRRSLKQLNELASV